MRDFRENHMKLPILALVSSVAFANGIPTFNKDVAPILYQNCASCHRPGEVAPFSLLTYQDAAKRAGQLAAVTKSRYMPPWKAERGEIRFRDERRLTDAQIRMIADWAKNGSPEGDPKEKPKPPQFAEGWQIGEPDQVITVPAKFAVPADGADAFRCFVVPIGNSEERYANDVEFRPGNRRVVHHALIYLDTTGAARKMAASQGGDSYSCFGGPGFPPSGGLGGWAPGASPTQLAAGLAYPIPKGADLVVQVHYHPDGKPEQDQSSIGLKFTAKPERALTTMLVGTRNIDIPAGESHYEVKQSLTVPLDAEAISITPHAHLICKDMKVDAELPDGTVKHLIHIPEWDFNWQGSYRFQDPILLPKGTRVSIDYIYDNSTNNPHNPSDPPKRVVHGEQTTNEMGLAFVQVALPNEEARIEFRKGLRAQLIKQFLSGGGSSEPK
jgi:hypothetical protein